MGRSCGKEGIGERGKRNLARGMGMRWRRERQKKVGNENMEEEKKATGFDEKLSVAFPDGRGVQVRHSTPWKMYVAVISSQV